MKKIIHVFIAGSLLAACNSKSKTELDANKQLTPLTDSSMIYNNSILTDTGTVITTDPSRNAISRSTGTVVPMAPHRIGSSPAPRSTGSRGTSESRGSNSGRSNSSSGNSGTVYTEPAPSRPEGMSSAAKDAVIGGVGGAVVGGIIGKGKGAVIGGVIGAGGGYVIGRSKDRRTGRVAQGKRYRRYKRSY